MRNRAVGEFAFAAAILCSFFCWARCYASANKSDNANRRANDYRFLRLYVGVLDMCSVIFQSLSDSPTKKISESEKKNMQQQQSHASFTMSRLLFWLYVISVTILLFNKKSVCILRQTVVENDGGGHLHFHAADKARKKARTYRPVYGIFVTTLHTGFLPSSVYWL